MSVRRPAFSAVALLILAWASGPTPRFQLGGPSFSAPSAVGDQDRLVALRGTAGDRPDSQLLYRTSRTCVQRGRTARGSHRPPAPSPSTCAPRRTGPPLGAARHRRTSSTCCDPSGRRAPVPGSDGVAPDKEPVGVISHPIVASAVRRRSASSGAPSRSTGGPSLLSASRGGFRGSMGAVLLDVFVPVTMQRAVMAGERLAERGSAFPPGHGPPDARGRRRCREASPTWWPAAGRDHPGVNEGPGSGQSALARRVAGMLMPVMGTLMPVGGVVLPSPAQPGWLAGSRGARADAGGGHSYGVGASRGRLIAVPVGEPAAGGPAAEWPACAQLLDRRRHRRPLPPTPYRWR